MKRKKDNTLTTFNRQARDQGITYAEAQQRETRGKMEKVRVPRGKDGEPVYMKVSARKTLENLRRKENRENERGSIFKSNGMRRICHEDRMGL